MVVVHSTADMYHHHRAGTYDDCGSGDSGAAAARAVRYEQRRKEFDRYVNSLKHQGLYNLAGEVNMRLHGYRICLLNRNISVVWFCAARLGVKSRCVESSL